MNNKILLLFEWLETWNSGGGYNGYVVHRYDSKRIGKNNPTCWAQGPIICGLVNLANKNDFYIEALKKACQYQLSLLDENNFKYKYSGHEDDRYSSIVHNSLANEGLLKASSFFNKRGESKFSEILKETVKRNIEGYIIKLWNDDIGAFKFSEIDYNSLDEDRFVSNMNIVTIYTLILLDREKYTPYIDKTLKFILSQQLKSDNKYLDGGFTYQQLEFSPKNEENPVVIYNGIIAEYLSEIYLVNKTSEIKEALENLHKYLLNNFDIKNELFYHDYKNQRLLEYPNFIAGSSFILKGIMCLNNVLGKDEFGLKNYSEKLLSKYQYLNGAVRNFKGYNSITNGRKSGKSSILVWEDFAPTISWNGKMFEYLSNFFTEHQKTTVNYRIIKFSSTFIYFENDKKVFILSWFPSKSSGIYFYNKKKIKPIICFSILKIYSKIRMLLIR